METLAEYLNGALDVHEAARQLTAPITDTGDHDELWYLWCLLIPVLVNESPDREKTMDLIAAIASLPPKPRLNWQQFPEFWFTWGEHYLGHMIGYEHWERKPFSQERLAKRRESYLASDSAASALYLRGLSVTAEWGYCAFSVVSWERPGIEVFLGQIYAWLSAASGRLKQDLRSGEAAQFIGKDGQITAMMEEHWERWAKELLALSEEGSYLPEYGRSMARACYRYLLTDTQHGNDEFKHAGARWT